MNAEAISLTSEQKATRLTGTGGSEIAAIAGVNPWASAFDVYLAKVDGFEIEQNEAMERGTFLEDGVARWYAHRMGAHFAPATGTIRHASNPYALCTPDRLVVFDNGREFLDLSIKVPGPTYGRESWGAAGTDDFPLMYLLQLQWELGILASRGFSLTEEHHLAAPIDGALRIYVVRRDPEVFADLLEINDAFWRNHIIPRIPPPMDGSDGAGRWLDRKFPRNREPLRAATLQESALVLALMEAEAKAEAAEGEREAAKNRLKASIGDGAGIEGAFGRVTWKANKHGVRSFKFTPKEKS